MRGSVFIMEIKKSWKGLLIFLLLIFIYHAGITAIYSIWGDMGIDGLEGEEFLNLTTDETGNVTLSWATVENASMYTVMSSNNSLMIPSTVAYSGNENSTVLFINPEDTVYLAVVAMVNNKTVFLGMTTNDEIKNTFADMFDNPFFQSFGGGRDIRLDTIEGFISVEMLSMLMFVGGIYLVYRSSASLSLEIEGKYLDILLSAPISRIQYILEKIFFLFFATLLFALVTATGIYLGMLSLGLAEPIKFAIIYLTILSSIPMFMVFQTIGLVGALSTKTGKGGFGIGMGAMVASYFFMLVAIFVEKLGWLQYLSINKYWDYNMILYDGSFPFWQTAVLCAMFIVLSGVAVYLFNMKDLPT
ncbi:MAG TPA: hypothetical protein ENN76_02780 [Euryarchaeota archaeon]|nr:hypothetical protein [Euryarchaeota archaeon]